MLGINTEKIIIMKKIKLTIDLVCFEFFIKKIISLELNFLKSSSLIF